MITVSARTLGSKRPVFDGWGVELPPDDFGDEGLTLRGLIERVVRAQVRSYAARHEARLLDRVLTARQIAEGLERGRVSPEGRDLGPAPDEDDAIGAAVQAFEDGLYLVIVDGEERRALDARVYLKPDSRVVFLRLVFLAGGF